MTERKHPPMTDLGNGLALEAIREMDGKVLTVSSSLSINHPETITNFARFACVLESAFHKGVASVSRPMDENVVAQHARAKQATDALVMQSSLLREENVRLKANIAELEVAHNAQSKLLLQNTRGSSSCPAGKVIQDAERWNELLHHAGADVQHGYMNGEFKIRRSYDEYTTYNLMKGAVSQHLTEYIDRMIEAKKGN